MDKAKQIMALVNTILANKSGGEETVYRDEPLVFPASQMKNYTPAKYKEMRSLATGSLYDTRDAYVFYRQARFMAEHEDDFEYKGDFIAYFPTYQAMSSQQLRGYFSWRTRLRRGELQKTCLSFAFVYVYELLNQIGVADPLDGFYKLRDFAGAYGKLDPGILRYTRLWLKDYVVYYDLDWAILEGRGDEPGDLALLTLLHYTAHSEAEIFDAVCALSKYKLKDSAFYKKNPEDVRTVTVRVFTALAEYYEKNRKNSLAARLFARRYSSNCTMFNAAVFYAPKKRPERVYTANDLLTYEYKNGYWICRRLAVIPGGSHEAGALLRGVDFAMRQASGYRSTLKAAENSKLIQTAIREAVDGFYAEKKRRAAPDVRIDVSKLRGIREAALLTQSKLVLDEEEAEAPPVAPPPEAAPQAEAAIPLDAVQREFLRRLLAGEPYGELPASGGRMLSVLVDGINEALFDLLGDAAILYEGETPVPAEDYIDEWKGLLGL